MNMKYNPWFYEYYKYLQGNRNGISTYNSTRYIDAFERYQKVSDLMENQPYGIVGNNHGFEKLIDLLSKSNYTFEDINDSLIRTYKENLQNAMGRMLTNTHSSIFHCNSEDSNYVTPDIGNVNYRIVDVPFNQLHFGNRDEFIRQKLEKIHHKAYKNYVYINEFVSDEIQSLLGFSIMITTNGRICNDWYVALSDAGFMFKIGWQYSEPCEFGIFMLDDCKTHMIQLSYDANNFKSIPKSYFKGNEYINKNCFVDIFNPEFSKTTRSIPAFGKFDDNGNLKLILQKQQHVELVSQKTARVNVIVYTFKFLHEVPNVFPAINYYDLMEGYHVYDTPDNRVFTDENKPVLSTPNEAQNSLEICTPPIILDRPTNISFETIQSCIKLRETLLSQRNNFINLGNMMRMPEVDDDTITAMIKIADDIWKVLVSQYFVMVNAAMLTSLIPYEYVKELDTVINNLFKFSNASTYNYQEFSFDEMYEGNWDALVYKITEPFENDKLKQFTIINEIQTNMFNDINDEYKSFNRPISEELFISFKYYRDEKAWLIDFPTISHFNGISNSFYINEKLSGDEIYKFFVLYSDTENPSEDRIVEPFEFDKIFDFDKFMNEVNKHYGFIKYWHNENKLMKMSKMIINKYDPETSIHILSKILKHKIDGEDILSKTPSDILYDTAGISTTSFDYTKTSENAPFVINYLFYTVNMMNNNEDKLQQYFFHHLVNDEFINSYVDINIKDFIFKENDTTKVNFSVIHKAPNSIELDNCVLPPNVNLNVFEGLPFIIKQNDVIPVNQYRYVFNEYSDGVKYTNKEYPDEEYFVKYNQVYDNGYKEYKYRNDIELCNLITQYMIIVYDIINELLNDYDHSYHKYKILMDYRVELNQVLSEIDKMHHVDFEYSESANIIDLLINDNFFVNTLNDLIELFAKLERAEFDNREISLTDLINKYILATIRYVYKTAGFKSEIYPNVRKLYIHLKRFNRKINLYQFHNWFTAINPSLLKQMDEYIAYNPEYDLPKNTFENLAVYLGQAKIRVLTAITSINEKTHNIDVLQQLHDLKEYIKTIKENYVFDLYCIDDITFSSTKTYSQKPYVGIIKITSNNFTLPNTTTEEVSLIFKIDSDKDSSGKYTITGINKIAEYVAFNDTPVNAVMSVLTSQNTEVAKLNVNMTFTRVSSNSDKFNSFDQLNYTGSTLINVENNHDTFEINNNGKIVNDVFSNMNYELMIGNKFIPLHHDTEMILLPDTYKPGAVDKVQISNHDINRFVNDSNTQSTKSLWWFKPSRVHHPDKCVGHGYFVGQKIYLQSEDGFVFPCIVSAIDHSQTRGFMEVEVDQVNTKWFNIDESLLEKYLDTEVKCTVIPDNISNYLDEYSGDYEYLTNIEMFDTHAFDNMSYYELPGDPLFVSNNAPYVYSRIIHNTEPVVPNEYTKYNVKYLDRVYVEDDSIRIDTINHNFNQLSDAELYPVLRTEPNDHKIWARELGIFEAEIDKSSVRIDMLTMTKTRYQEQMKTTKSVYQREIIGFKIESVEKEIEYEREMQKRLQSYVRELEKPTTWFNVYSHDAAEVYIMNGRAVSVMPYYHNDIRDIAYSDKAEILLYDETNKRWLDPGDYTVTKDIVNDVSFDNLSDYKTEDVLYSLKITLNESVSEPISILVYMAYNKSDIFNDIYEDNNTCYTLFKPYFNISKENDSFNPYDNIQIRKHISGKEVYKYDSVETIEGIGDSCISIKRPDINGKYNAPPLRMCDILIENGSQTFDYQEIDLWIKNPFIDTDTDTMLKNLSYDTTVVQPVEYYNDSDGDVKVKLICINANHFDGNVSDIIFDAVLKYNGNQVIEVIDSSLPKNASSSTFVCTVIKDDDYKPIGGVIIIHVNTSGVSVLSSDSTWVKVPSEFAKYRIIPKECVLSLKDNVIDNTKPVMVTLKSEYHKDYTDTVLNTNDHIYNPYEYYYDEEHKVRYPLSAIYSNNINKRLVIDAHQHSNVKLIKATYIGICRYALQIIPSSGIINVTGYIPTPLTRERYQFWVNGEDKTNSDDLHIISPTSIQFTNLTSLRNFELVELVYDMNDSLINAKGNVYVDLNGKAFSSYNLCLKSNAPIIKQSLQYTFNINNHTPLHDYTSSIINNPNNVNIDTDILDYIITPEPKTYNDIHNTPIINGVPLHHPTFTSLGFVESSNLEIINKLDNVWKKEILTNPHFCITHKNGVYNNSDVLLTLHVRKNVNTTCDADYYIGYVTGISEEYLSMYVSNNSTDNIYDTSNVLKIVGFIRTGVEVFIDKSYHGKWLHTTANTQPIIIK